MLYLEGRVVDLKADAEVDAKQLDDAFKLTGASILQIDSLIRQVGDGEQREIRLIQDNAKLRNNSYSTFEVILVVSLAGLAGTGAGYLIAILTKGSGQ